MMTVAQRFLKYTGFETTSCEMSESCPSTPGQMELAGRWWKNCKKWA